MGNFAWRQVNKSQEREKTTTKTQDKDTATIATLSGCPSPEWLDPRDGDDGGDCVQNLCVVLLERKQKQKQASSKFVHRRDRLVTDRVRAHGPELPAACRECEAGAQMLGDRCVSWLMAGAQVRPRELRCPDSEHMW